MADINNNNNTNGLPKEVSDAVGAAQKQGFNDKLIGDLIYQNEILSKTLIDSNKITKDQLEELKRNNKGYSDIIKAMKGLETATKESTKENKKQTKIKSTTSKGNAAEKQQAAQFQAKQIIGSIDKMLSGDIMSGSKQFLGSFAGVEKGTKGLIGGLGSAGRFLSGPWGIALQVGVGAVWKFAKALDKFTVDFNKQRFKEVGLQADTTFGTGAAKAEAEANALGINFVNRRQEFNDTLLKMYGRQGTRASSINERTGKTTDTTKYELLYGPLKNAVGLLENQGMDWKQVLQDMADQGYSQEKMTESINTRSAMTKYLGLDPQRFESESKKIFDSFKHMGVGLEFADSNIYQFDKQIKRGTTIFENLTSVMKNFGNVNDTSQKGGAMAQLLLNQGLLKGTQFEKYGGDILSLNSLAKSAFNKQNPDLRLQNDMIKGISKYAENISGEKSGRKFAEIFNMIFKQLGGGDIGLDQYNQLLKSGTMSMAVSGTGKAVYDAATGKMIKAGATDLEKEGQENANDLNKIMGDANGNLKTISNWVTLMGRKIIGNNQYRDVTNTGDVIIKTPNVNPGYGMRPGYNPTNSTIGYGLPPQSNLTRKAGAATKEPQ